VSQPSVLTLWDRRTDIVLLTMLHTQATRGSIPSRSNFNLSIRCFCT
jgi:hypothetical protein